MPTTDLSVVVEGNRAVVGLRGEHESYSADRLARHLDALLAEGLSIAVDLSATEFVDSTVVGVLLAGSHRAKTRLLGFVLVLGEGTGWPVQRLLDVTGLRSQFAVVEERAFR
ncbi:MAG TPA: STAS domain-containing protein [Gaiellaceae bacterium]|nr:STAS domain-containing protein [Gaiellaceae bacterium]